MDQISKEISNIDKTKINEFRKVMYKKMSYEYNSLLEEDKNMMK
jgi:hypothetical protein